MRTVDSNTSSMADLLQLLHANETNDALDTGYKTIMIKHIPRHFTQEALLHEVETVMGKGVFDYFYVPWDVKRNTNCGCVFINFVTHAAAVKCMKLFSGRRFSYANSSKVCQVVPAHIQGLQGNLKNFCERAAGIRCKNPLVFQGGVPMDLNWSQVAELCQNSEHDVIDDFPPLDSVALSQLDRDVLRNFYEKFGN